MEAITFKGVKRLNESVSPELLGQDEVPTMSNLVLDRNGYAGIPCKRGGWTRFNTNSASNPPVSLYDTKDEAGTNFLLGSCNGILKKSSSGTGTWENVKTGLTAGKIRFTPVSNGQIVCTNGVEAPFVISGSGFGTVVDLEIARPDASVITSSYTSGGSLTASKEYRWILVYVTETGEYSAPSQPFTSRISLTGADISTTDASNKTIQFKNIPVSADSRVIYKKLYRTAGITATSANHNLYYYVNTIVNATTTYTDSLADTDLDTSDYIEFKNVPNKAKYSAYNRDRLFFGNINLDSKSYYEPALVKAETSLSGGYTASKTFTGTTQTVVGSGLNAGVYKWRLTFIDDAGLESTYADSESVTIAAGNTKILLVNIPIFAYTVKTAVPVVRYKLYRTAVNGSTFYYVTDISPLSNGNWNFYYEDSTTDGSLLGQYATFGTTDYNSAIMFSDILKPASFPLQNIIQIFPDDGDEITGIFDDPNGLLVFKRNSIAMVYTEGSPVNWRIVKVNETIGCDEPDAICSAGARLFFVHRKKVYSYSGGQIELISDPIKVTLGTVTTFHNIAYIWSRNWVVLAVTITSTDYILVFDEKVGSWYVFTINDCVSVIEKVHGSNAGTILIGDGNYVVKYDTGVSADNDTGSNVEISGTLRTKTYTFPDGVSLARMRTLHINANLRYNGVDSSAITYLIKNPDDALQKTATYDNATGGWFSYRYPTEVMTGNLTVPNKLYIQASGLGIDILNEMRLEYRPIRRGKGIGI